MSQNNKIEKEMIENIMSRLERENVHYTVKERPLSTIFWGIFFTSLVVK